MKKCVVRMMGLFLVFAFALGMAFSFAPSEAEARSYNPWKEIRKNFKRDAVRFVRRIYREYENDYIQQIRDANKWRRLERQDMYKARREARRAALNGNSRYNSTPQCVYYITAGDEVLGSLETRRQLSEKEEATLELISSHLKSGTPINTKGMTYGERSRIKVYCREMGIPLRIDYMMYYVG